MKINESIRKCAERELYEESNIKGTNFSLSGIISFNHKYENRNYEDMLVYVFKVFFNFY